MKIEQLFVAFCVMSMPLYAEASDKNQTPETPKIPAPKTPKNKEKPRLSRSPIVAVKSADRKAQPQNLDKPVGQFHTTTLKPSQRDAQKPNVRVTDKTEKSNKS